MNKNEFYKELMSQYTFDEDKIRRNAKRVRNSPLNVLNSKWIPLASAAAVFVTVFSGYTILMANKEIDDKPPYYSATNSQYQRIFDAENTVEILANQPQSTKMELYVSFEKPLSYSEIELTLGLLSDTGEIEILKVYDDDNKKFVEKSKADGTQKSSAVKVAASAGMFTTIKDSNSVVLVEIASEMVTDDTFTPITKENVEQVNDNTPVFTEPVATMTQKPAVTTERPKIELPVETSPIISTQTEAPPVEKEIEELPEDDGLIEIPELPESTTATTPPSSPEPEETNPPIVEITILSLNIEGAIAVQFINDDHFFVTTANSIELYRISDGSQREFELVSRQDARNPKISNINHDEKVFLITGEDIYDVRNKLFVVNGTSSTLIPVDMKLYDAGIAYSYYKNGLIISKTKSYDYESFYYSRLDGDHYYSKKIRDFDEQAALLSLSSTSFIYAITDDESSKLFEYDMLTSTVTPLKYNLKERAVFVRSSDVTNFAVVTSSEVQVFNSENRHLIEGLSGTNVEFSKADSRYFTVDGESYLISGEGFVSVDNPVYSAGTEIYSNLYGLFSTSATDVKIQIF